MEIVESVKLVGALVGLLTGFFVVADRVLLHRRIVTWHRTEHNVGVSIKNSANESVLIEDILVSPDGWAVAWSNERGDTVETAARAIKFEGEEPDPISFVLPADGERTFFTVRREQTLPDQDVKIRVRWRSCRNRWLPQLPVTLKANPAFFASLENARI